MRCAYALSLLIIFASGCSKGDSHAPLASPSNGNDSAVDGRDGAVAPDTSSGADTNAAPDTFSNNDTSPPIPDTSVATVDADYESGLGDETSPTSPGTALPHTDPISGCTYDVLVVATPLLHPVAPTNIAMIKAWPSGTAGIPNGLFLVQLQGLQSSPLAVNMTLATPNTASPPAVDTFAQGPVTVATDTVAANRRVNASLNTPSLALRFRNGSNVIDVPITEMDVAGLLNADCSGFTDLAFDILIPQSAGSTPFGGTTLDALMGSSLTPLPDGSQVYELSLDGSATAVGG